MSMFQAYYTFPQLTDFICNWKHVVLPKLYALSINKVHFCNWLIRSSLYEYTPNVILVAM